MESVSDGDEGYRQGLRNSYDILLLDGMLPKKSKFDVGRDLHGAGINIPILMLTARTQVVHKVVGLRMGGMTI